MYSVYLPDCSRSPLSSRPSQATFIDTRVARRLRNRANQLCIVHQLPHLITGIPATQVPMPAGTGIVRHRPTSRFQIQSADRRESAWRKPLPSSIFHRPGPVQAAELASTSAVSASAATTEALCTCTQGRAVRGSMMLIRHARPRSMIVRTCRWSQSPDWQAAEQPVGSHSRHHAAEQVPLQHTARLRRLAGHHRYSRPAPQSAETQTAVPALPNPR